MRELETPRADSRGRSAWRRSDLRGFSSRCCPSPSSPSCWWWWWSDSRGSGRRGRCGSPAPPASTIPRPRLRALPTSYRDRTATATGSCGFSGRCTIRGTSICSISTCERRIGSGNTLFLPFNPWIPSWPLVMSMW